MSGHTPGPWRAGDAGHTVFGQPRDGRAPEMIAQRVAPANAQLIARAPELLAEVERLRGAVAGILTALPSEYGPDGNNYGAIREALRVARSALAVRS